MATREVAAVVAAAVVQPRLARKVLNVMKRVGWVAKRGENKFHKYNYATEADVTDKVREACIEEGIIMVPTIKSIAQREKQTREGHATISQVLMSYRVEDVDTGESFEFEMAGEGMDSGDKSIFKAVTGAGKYADMKLFKIPTGDDPEADEKTDKAVEGAPPKPVEVVVDVVTTDEWANLGILLAETATDSAKVCEFFHIKNLADLPRSEYPRAVKMLESKKKGVGRATAKS